ncbi:MAG: tRNA (adenosine(37)-N6)-dimethylallyltransferase MiaA [Pseudomonadota bacterium]
MRVEEPKAAEREPSGSAVARTGAESEPLIVVVGPTASGKTDLAIELAERFDGEIVSADSVQIYRHFDIGSGKPSADERARVPHHLIDAAEPDAPLDAARFAELAETAIDSIRARGKRPIVCGGTFLWVRALVYGLAPAPPADPEVRARHAERAEREGRAALHAELKRVDPESAARLAPNDFVRVSRALEVYELTGVPLSRFQAEHGFRVPRRRVHLVGVRRTREELDDRIRARIERMLDAGWIDEVRSLLERGYGQTRPMGSVGYRQVARAITEDAIDREVLATEIFRATRVFARRQRTWLRDEPVEWVENAAAVSVG